MFVITSIKEGQSALDSCFDPLSSMSHPTHFPLLNDTYTYILIRTQEIEKSNRQKLIGS